MLGPFQPLKHAAATPGAGRENSFVRELQHNPVVWSESLAAAVQNFIVRRANGEMTVPIRPRDLAQFCAALGSSSGSEYQDRNSYKLANSKLFRLALDTLSRWSDSGGPEIQTDPVWQAASKIKTDVQGVSYKYALDNLRRSFFVDNARLNLRSPVTFQFDRGIDRVTYMHFDVNALRQGVLPDSTPPGYRIYVNCDVRAQIALAESMLAGGLGNYSFKLAKPIQDREPVQNRALVIVYPKDESTAGIVLDLLTRERARMPEYFRGRTVSSFLSSVGDGIGISSLAERSVIEWQELSYMISAKEYSSDYPTHRAHMLHALSIKMVEFMISEDSGRDYTGHSIYDLERSADSAIQTYGIPAPSSIRGALQPSPPEIADVQRIAKCMLIAPFLFKPLSVREFHSLSSRFLPEVCSEYRVDSANLAKDLDIIG